MIKTRTDGTAIDSQAWCAYAKANSIEWSYHTVDEHPVGRVEFVSGSRPDVRATLVSRGMLSLRGLTSKGKQAVKALQEVHSE